MAKLVNVRTQEEYPLTGDVVVIGRLPACEIRVLEKQVSRRHCRIVRAKEGWILTDSGSMLGTMLNGELLMHPHCLEPGDEVKVGTEAFVFDKHIAKPRGDVKLRPLSKAAASDLVPRDAFDSRRRSRLLVLAGAAAVAAIAAAAAALALPRPTPSGAVRKAAELLRTRKAKELWELVSAKLRADTTFEEFESRLKALPEEALGALRTLEVGKASDTDRGTVVLVTVRVNEEVLADEVILCREGGRWKILSVPTQRLSELTQ